MKAPFTRSQIQTAKRMWMEGCVDREVAEAIGVSYTRAYYLRAYRLQMPANRKWRPR